MNIVEGFFKAGIYKTALIIGAETLSKVTDWNDRGTCVLFGDGAGAAVLKAEETGIIDMMMGADGTRVMFSPAPREPSETFSQGQSRSSDL